MTSEQREAIRRLVWEIQTRPDSIEARARMAALLGLAREETRPASS